MLKRFRESIGLCVVLFFGFGQPTWALEAVTVTDIQFSNCPDAVPVSDVEHSDDGMVIHFKKLATEGTKKFRSPITATVCEIQFSVRSREGFEFMINSMNFSVLNREAPDSLASIYFFGRFYPFPHLGKSLEENYGMQHWEVHKQVWASGLDEHALIPYWQKVWRENAHVYFKLRLQSYVREGIALADPIKITLRLAERRKPSDKAKD